MNRNLRLHWIVLMVVSLTAATCSGAAPPDTLPNISGGKVTSGIVEIDGTAIEYIASVPEGFTAGDQAPLLLAFPPGGQDIGTARSWIDSTYAAHARELGWVVISPAAPGGKTYFDGSEDRVPGLLDWVETWVTPEGGAPHVAGISNGGISAFRYAGQNSDRVLSLIAFPGFPQTGGDQRAIRDLTDVPIRIFVGGQDTIWVDAAQNAVDVGVEAGGDIQLSVLSGEGHVLTSTRDGNIVFSLLEGFRTTG